VRIIFVALLIFGLACGNLAAEETNETLELSDEDAEVIQNLEILEELEMLQNSGLLEDYEVIKSLETQEAEGEINEEDN
jgi:hypothetical protein